MKEIGLGLCVCVCVKEYTVSQYYNRHIRFINFEQLHFEPKVQLIGNGLKIQLVSAFQFSYDRDVLHTNTDYTSFSPFW